MTDLNYIPLASDNTNLNSTTVDTIVRVNGIAHDYVAYDVNERWIETYAHDRRGNPLNDGSAPIRVRHYGEVTLENPTLGLTITRNGVKKAVAA